MRATMIYDVVIVGAGPAGLAAATSLGRAARRTLLIHGGPPRNTAAAGIHGFLSREGLPPSELQRLALEELAGYRTLDVRASWVVAVRGERDAFVVELEDGSHELARRVLLCTGVEDELPDLPGYRDLWGTTVFQCPFCHGYEWRSKTFGYLAPQADALDFAELLTAWSTRVRVFTDSNFEVSAETKATLLGRDISIEERKVQRLVAREPGRLRGVELEGGALLECDVLFVRPPQRQNDVVRELGLTLEPDGSVRVDASMETSRRGVSAAGDATLHVHGVMSAAAAGAVAGNSLVRDLLVSAK